MGRISEKEKPKKKKESYESPEEMEERLEEIEEDFSNIIKRAVVVLIFTIIAGKLFTEGTHRLFKHGYPIFDLLIIVNDVVEWRELEREKKELLKQLEDTKEESDE